MKKRIKTAVCLSLAALMLSVFAACSQNTNSIGREGDNIFVCGGFRHYAGAEGGIHAFEFHTNT